MFIFRTYLYACVDILGGYGMMQSNVGTRRMFIDKYQPLGWSVGIRPIGRAKPCNPCVMSFGMWGATTIGVSRKPELIMPVLLAPRI